jgi:polysaccharide export outer membrane protein
MVSWLRHKRSSPFGRAKRTAGLAQVFLTAVACLGAPALLRGQDPARAPEAPGILESSLNSGSHFAAVTEDYVISPDDELDIYVLDVSEISRLYRVSPSGSIMLALPPVSIVAAGLSPRQLSEALGEVLRTSGMVANPHVTVQVKQSRVHSVSIGGAVKKPQIYPLYGKMTLLDALSQAEGLADDAGNTAMITRGDIAIHALGPAQDGQIKTGQPVAPQTVTVNLKRLLEDGDVSLNLDLYAGDRVTVQRAGIVYVVGAVNRSGGYPLRNDREEMTVLKAIALAENLKSTAIPKKAVIIRKVSQASGKSEEIPVDLNKILSGHLPDRQLFANDILFIPDSSSKKAMRRAGEAAAQAAALVVYRVPW